MSEVKGFDPTEEALVGDETKILGTLKKWHEAAAKHRQILDWNWYLYQNYYKGNHYIQYNKVTNQLVTPPQPKGQVRLVVNKIYSILRSIRNFVTSYRPVWTVVANSTNEEEVNSGEKSADLLDYYYDHLGMPRIIKSATNLTTKYGLSFFQYAWDEEAVGIDNQMGECAVWVRDPFDVYADPAGVETGELQNCRFIDIAVSRPIQDILSNSNYKTIQEDEVSPDTKRAASSFKDMLIRMYYGGDGGSDELATTILHETYYKKRVKTDTKDDAGKKITQIDSQVWVASWIEGHLLRNEKTEFNRYNLIPFPSDNNADELCGEGYIKNLIPPQKVLNRLESQVVEYNNLVNRGRILVEKDAGINKITNETGEIIEHNAGTAVQFWNPTGLSADIHAQITRVNGYMEEISGVREAFQGAAPVGVKSGVALESLKQQSANNLQDLKDNLETALAELGEGILELVANKVVASRQVRSLDQAGKAQAFNFKGQVGATPGEMMKPDTYLVGNQNKVKVVIGSGLAYTKEGREARLDKMLEQKVIAPATYLRAIEFGDVDGAIKDSVQYQLNQAMIESMAAPTPAGAPGAAPMGDQGVPPAAPAPTDQGGDSWTKLADDEDHAMLTGQIIPPTKDAPKEHTAVHIAWSQSPEVQDHEPLMKALFEHIQGEEQLQGAPHTKAPKPAKKKA